MPGVFIKKGDLDTSTQGDMNMKAEVGVICREAKEHQRSLPNQQKLGERHREDSLAQPTEGTNAASALILASRTVTP